MATTEPEFCALKDTQPRVTGAPNAVLEKIHEWKGMGENLLNSLVDCFSDIESREQSLRLDRESLEKREKDLEERELKFDLFVGEKNAGLMLREESLDEQLKLVREHIDRLEAAQGLTEGFGNRKHCEKLKEIEDREREIDAVCRSIEKRLRDVEKKEKEFDKLCNGKLRELDLEKEILSKEKKQFGEDVRLVNEELKKKQKIGCDLIERLESTLKLLERMKVGLDERFQEMAAWEAAAQQSLTDKLDDAELIKVSLEKRFQEIGKIEQEFNVFLEDKTRQLESKEQEIRAMRKGLKEEQLSDEHKLGHQNSESEKLKEIESVDVVSPKDADLTTESSNNQELKQKMLNMLMNTTEEDLELMDDEIFKVLLLSSDPAKLVLDAVVGLYSSKLGNGSEESKVKRVCILLLYHLTKMSPNIQPCVREEALKLALIWMSYLNTAPENPLEVLMLLHLLAAYNLSSHFDKDQLFSFVKSVVQHKQTPALCHILGLADKIPDIIQNLINEKQYLLASSYIYEFGLDNRFSQSAVLGYYVMQAKLLAKEKCRREQKPFEAQGKAEIADLRVAIEHIIKYGLEYEYSPDVLTERIKQLERNTSPLSSCDFQKQGKGKRRWDQWDVQKKQHNEHWSSSQWKAQNWHRRDEHPSTSAVGFHKREGPMTHLNRSQKRRRKKYNDSITVRPTSDHQ